MLGAIVGDIVGSVYEFYGLTEEEIRIVEGLQ
jgi:ADP-ribosylglycohydrolase